MSLQTNIPQLNQNISLDGQHSAVIAYLGQLALSKPSLPDLLTDAITLILHVLPAEFVWLWEPDADGEHLTLKISSSSKEEAGVESQIRLAPNSLEELVLRSSYPILVHELKADNRFKPSHVLQASESATGLAVLVGSVQKPLGILEAFSREQHTYSQNDVHFFHSVANILAFFMDAKRQESIWAEMETDLRKQIWKVQATPQSDAVASDLHEIKNRLVESRERERLRLAQELHDNPIQDLYGLMYQMDDLREMLHDTHGMQILEEFNSTIHRVVNSLRATCGELRPPSLSPFGLEVAIRDHVEKLHGSHPNLQVHLDLMRDQQILSDGIRLCLFRIYQQAISNVIRHSQATDAYVRFRWDDEIVTLEVEDNGSGFELPERWVDLVRQECFGLVGIAERVESVQGNLGIRSTPGNGTLIQVSVPRR